MTETRTVSLVRGGSWLRPTSSVGGGIEPAIIEGLPDVKRDMAAAGVDFQAIVYPESGHAFLNNTGPRDNPVDAADAWSRVTAFVRA